MFVFEVVYHVERAFRDRRRSTCTRSTLPRTWNCNRRGPVVLFVSVCFPGWLMQMSPFRSLRLVRSLSS